jgi:hypothetical protein
VHGHGFAKLLRTLIAAHFDHAGADFYFDRIRIEGAVARRTGFLSHDSISLMSPHWALSEDHYGAAPAVEIFSYIFKRRADCLNSVGDRP